MKESHFYAFEGMPLIQPRDRIGSMICEVAKQENFIFEGDDIVVIASKIISKAEGQLVDTRKIRPSKEALLLSEKIGIDPKNLEVILQETKRLLIARPDLLLTEHNLGFICTKAGVDSSNTIAGLKGQVVAILPKDSDSSAREICREIEKITGKKIAVIISDTFGRPDRMGSVGMAIGISGIVALHFPQIKKDIHGKIRHPEIAQVDEIAAAASLLMGQTNERRPVVVLRGVEYQRSETSKIQDLLHPSAKYIEDATEIARRIEKS